MLPPPIQERTIMTKRLLSTQRIVNISSDPVTGSAGEIYFNTDQNILKYHDGTQWLPLGGGGGAVNIDGGLPSTTYGGVSPIDGGTP